jgi:hypothetical protein
MAELTQTGGKGERERGTPEKARAVRPLYDICGANFDRSSHKDLTTIDLSVLGAVTVNEVINQRYHDTATDNVA